MSKEVKRYKLFASLRPEAIAFLPDEVVSARDYDALLAERDALKKDAERYRWLRMADWWNSPICAVRDPANQVKPGSDCPSRDRLDTAIDAALQWGQQ